MTTQIDLQKVWASGGGTTDPDIATPGKYILGWEVEIPTYQNFNYVLKNSTNNILVLAEKGTFVWQTGISYAAGSEVIGSDGEFYTCRAATSTINPVTDTAQAFWIQGKRYGAGLPTDVLGSQGVLVKNVNPRISPVTWDGNDITLESPAPIQAFVGAGATKNWGLANVSGEMVTIDFGTTDVPDGRSIALADASVHRLFHEGHHPLVSEVTDAVEEAPTDSKAYARINGVWQEVSTTTVSTEPPPPVNGAGASWYNLDIGQYFVDIDDGTSSQWVIPNPPLIPVYTAADIAYDNTTSGLLATNMQDAIDELAALHP